MATAYVKIPGCERKVSVGYIKRETKYALNNVLFRLNKKEPPLATLARARTEIGSYNSCRIAVLAFFNKAVEDIERRIEEGAEAILIRTLLQERIRALY